MDISANSVPAPSLTDAKASAVPIVGRHIPALDGIRGVATLMVLIHHLVRGLTYEFNYTNPILHLATFGWSGVDLFFVLSGFLITGILFDQKTSSHYFKNFYARRALRIFPLYFGALLFIFVLRHIWPEDSKVLWGTQNHAWMWVYMQNIVISVKGFGSFGIVDHFWSLAIEEHFYLVWPLVVFMLNRKQLISVAATLVITSFVLRIVLSQAGARPDALIAFTPLRLDSLAMGAIIALLVRGPRGFQWLVRPAKILAVVSAVVVIVIVMVRQALYFDDWGIQTFGFTFIGLFCTCLLILGVASPMERLLNTGILRMFGKYSYGLYVWHPIFFVLFFHTDLARTVRGSIDMIPVQVIGSITLALVTTGVFTYLSWNLWEKQFLKLKRYF